MSIIRVKKDSKYFAASNEPFNDKRLSWEARGVMGYLLSKPDDWQVMFNDLVNSGPAGAKVIRRVLKELQEYKYLDRKRKQLPDGKFEWVSTIYETPYLGDETILPIGVDGETILPKRIYPSRTYPKRSHVLSTESPSTESLSTEGIKDSGAKRPHDERLSHPAITTYRNIARMTPPAAVRDDIIQAVGDDFVKWGNVVKDWIGHGWKPGNITGMLDYYKNGGNGYKPAQNGRRAEPAGFAAIREYMEEQANGNV